MREATVSKARIVGQASSLRVPPIQPVEYVEFEQPLRDHQRLQETRSYGTGFFVARNPRESTFDDDVDDISIPRIPECGRVPKFHLRIDCGELPACSTNVD